ncbi:MAG: glycosyltransferase [Acidobacteriota bacterium]
MSRELEQQSAVHEPDLSIIVAVIAGGQDAMTTCLTQLEPHVRGRNMECLAPYDARLDGVPALAARFPWVRFIDARGQVDASKFGDSSREHHDILRAIGLNQARGRLIALLEDHGTPSPDWLPAVLEAHRGPEAAIGGAVENGLDRPLNWAVYYCDFGRYQNPVPEGPAEFLSDSNVSYKREALWQVKEHWQSAFHETSVNWELQRRGERLRLEPRMVVYQTRRGLRFLPALRERFVWGRSFAGTRAKEISAAKRLILAALSFLLPAVLTLRIVRLTLSRGRNLDRLALALPLILLLQTVWAAGELAGYVTGKATSGQLEADYSGV